MLCRNSANYQISVRPILANQKVTNLTLKVVGGKNIRAGNAFITEPVAFNNSSAYVLSRS